MSSQMDTLSNQYNSLITQYQETYQEFLNTINSGDNSFTSVPNAAFVGSNNISVLQNSSLNSCMNSCTEDQSCSGATFDDGSQTCTMGGGVGNIVNSTNQTAIVKQALFYSYQLQSINNELLTLNNTMTNIINNNVGTYQQTQQKITDKSTILEQNYNTLEQERIEIEKMIKEYHTLNTANDNGSINVTSNYYSYILYLIIAVFLVLLLLRFSVGGNSQMGGGSYNMKIYPLLFVMLAVIIIFNAYIKK